MEFGPFTELYTYVVGIAASFALIGINYATQWKAKLNNTAFLKTLQPLAVALIAVFLNWLAGIVPGIDALLGQECLVDGVGEACNAFASGAAAALVAIPFREIMARVPVADKLFNQ
jgi:hypothetical protein